MNVVFLDRDGTVIVDPPDERVDKIEKITLFPDTIDALKLFADHGYAAVFITNQAAIAEGRMTEEDFWRIQDAVMEQLAPSGIKFLKTYMNSEAPNAISDWRKPGPKMLLQAAADYNLTLRDIYMIGDRPSDVQAAINAGCKGGILVKTANVLREAPSAIYVALNLLDAARYVIDHTVSDT